MITITTVTKTQETLADEIDELGGTITASDKNRYNSGEIEWEVEAYFDDYTALEMELASLCEGTAWEVDLGWDSEHDGVLFQRVN